MSTPYGVLEWTNEHSLGSYPLASTVEPIDFIVDASFIQFDNFIPILKTIKVTSTELTLTIATDSGDMSMVVKKPTATFFPGYSQRLYNGDRHVGFLSFGQGLVTLFDTYLNNTLRLNVAFLPAVVRSLNSSAGVYSIQGYTGEVEIYTGATPPERTLFFDQVENTVTWNAGYLPPASTLTPLLTLNGVHPRSNAIFIQDSDLIKVKAEVNGINLSLGVPVTTNTISSAKRYA